MFGHVPKQIQIHTQKKKKTQKALNALYLRDRDGSLGQEINMLRTETNDLLDSEEIVWHLIKSAMVGPWRWQTQSIFAQKLLKERRNTPSRHHHDYG